VINCDTNAGFLGTLQGVNIVDVVNGVTNVIASNISLTNGQVFPFSGSYTNPNPCAPITDTVSASGVTAARHNDSHKFALLPARTLLSRAW
jgi:hypothetical protein